MSSFNEKLDKLKASGTLKQRLIDRFKQYDDENERLEVLYLKAVNNGVLTDKELAKDLVGEFQANKIACEKMRKVTKEPYMTKGKIIDSLARDIGGTAEIREKELRKLLGLTVGVAKKSETDQTRLTKLSSQINEFVFPEMETEEGKLVIEKVKTQFSKIVVYINQQVGKIPV